VRDSISSHILFVTIQQLGIRNYLIEGVSGTGKTSVCKELQRRGYHAINGDRELAYQGDPKTGKPTDGRTHEHHIWHVDKVKALVANQDEAVTFFCGGSRNSSKFIDLFDGVFVLEVDLDTLNRRLDERPEDEWGKKQTEREPIVRLHQTEEDIPKSGIMIDATPPIAHVVDEIVRQTEQVVGWSAGVQQHDDEAEDQRGGIAEPQLFKPKADRA
jgi:broad-specificity NMP kinase